MLALATSVVEVTRATRVTSLQLVILSVGAIAAAIVVVAVVAAWNRRVDRAGQALLLTALTLSIVELALRLADAGFAASDPRVLAIAGRVGALVAMLMLNRERADSGVTHVTYSLGAVVLLTVPLAMPLAATPQGAFRAFGATAALVFTAWLIVKRKLDVTTISVFATAAAVALIIIGLPPPAPEAYDARLIVDNIELDVTVIPDSREIHVYAWDQDGLPATIEQVEVSVPSASHHLLLFEVSPDHHLSYMLVVPEELPLDLELTAMHDGRELSTTWTIGGSS